MDDGSVLRQFKTSTNISSYVFNTQGFFYSDQLILVQALRSQFNLSTNL
jgi:hypothetical protein